MKKVFLFSFCCMFSLRAVPINPSVANYATNLTAAATALTNAATALTTAGYNDLAADATAAATIATNASTAATAEDNNSAANYFQIASTPLFDAATVLFDAAPYLSGAAQTAAYNAALLAFTASAESAVISGDLYVADENLVAGASKYQQAALAYEKVGHINNILSSYSDGFGAYFNAAKNYNKSAKIIIVIEDQLKTYDKQYIAILKAFATAFNHGTAFLILDGASDLIIDNNVNASRDAMIATDNPYINAISLGVAFKNAFGLMTTLIGNLSGAHKDTILIYFNKLCLGFVSLELITAAFYLSGVNQTDAFTHASNQFDAIFTEPFTFDTPISNGLNFLNTATDNLANLLKGSFYSDIGYINDLLANIAYLNDNLLKAAQYSVGAYTAYSASIFSLSKDEDKLLAYGNAGNSANLAGFYYNTNNDQANAKIQYSLAADAYDLQRNWTTHPSNKGAEIFENAGDAYKAAGDNNANINEKNIAYFNALDRYDSAILERINVAIQATNNNDKKALLLDNAQKGLEYIKKALIYKNGAMFLSDDDQLNNYNLAGDAYRDAALEFAAVGNIQQKGLNYKNAGDAYILAQQYSKADAAYDKSFEGASQIEDIKEYVDRKTSGTNIRKRAYVPGISR